jgi:transposase InsO family protein
MALSTPMASISLRTSGALMRDHMRAELTIAALTMAIQRQKAPPGLIHHSDSGSHMRPLITARSSMQPG